MTRDILLDAAHRATKRTGTAESELATMVAKRAFHHITLRILARKGMLEWQRGKLR